MGNYLQGLDANLRRLYVDEGLSLSAIAARYGCALTTVWRHAVAAGLERREAGGTPLHTRADFSGDACERAYLIGLRIGDLNVEREGNTIVIKCTSTRDEQVELFKSVFQRYGNVYTDVGTLAQRKRQSIGMSARLNLSFEFLLPKEDCVPQRVLETTNASLPSRPATSTQRATSIPIGTAAHRSPTQSRLRFAPMMPSC
jgi:hypothetical protein